MTEPANPLEPNPADLDLLGRYLRGELPALRIEEFSRRLGEESALRAAWEDHQIRCWLDGDLSAAEARTWQNRVETDEAAARLAAQYQALDTALHRLAQEQPTFDFAAQREAVLQRIEDQAAIRRRRVRQWVVRPLVGALTAAAVFVLALGAYLLFRSAAHPPADTFRAVVVPPAPAPLPDGRLVARILPLPDSDAPAAPKGTVLAARGAEPAASFARRMTPYMMLACVVGLPPAVEPAACFAPLWEAWACLWQRMESRPGQPPSSPSPPPRNRL